MKNLVDVRYDQAIVACSNIRHPQRIYILIRLKQRERNAADNYK